MTELIEVIITALACPLVLPLVVEQQKKQDE